VGREVPTGVGRPRDGGGCRGGHGSQADVLISSLFHEKVCFKFMFHEKVCFELCHEKFPRSFKIDLISEFMFCRKFQEKSKSKFILKVSKKFQDCFDFRIHVKVCRKFQEKSKSKFILKVSKKFQDCFDFKVSRKFQEKSKSKFILRIHPKVCRKFVE
jgi:hypothetical protein